MNTPLDLSGAPPNRPMLDLSGPVPTIDGVPVWLIFGATSPAARYGTSASCALVKHG
jgi:hypothetical protein